MTKVFISYRREDSKVIAGRIYDYLTPPLGPYEPQHVFKDVDSIPLGVNFKTHLERQVAQCAVALVIIGPNWLHIKNEDGSRRLDDESDFVRIEIESALKREIPVIPLLVMGAQMPKAQELPPSLAPLAFQNGTTLRDDPDFRNDMARLRRSLEHWLNPAPPKIEVVPPIAAPTETAAGTLRTDEHGIEMVYVPAGTFLMGSSEAQVDAAFKAARKKYKDAKREWYENELPQHSVTLAQGYWIDKFPVTNRAYLAFIAANGYQTERYWTADGWWWVVSKTQGGKVNAPYFYKGFDAPNQPRVGVTWYEAIAYAKWRGVRLPNEAEWEYAARGKTGQIYPWGDEFDPDKAVFADNSGGKTAPVGSKPEGASWVGALDMAGNVWEWTTTIYDESAFPYQFKTDQRDNIGGSRPRVLRGGLWDGSSTFLRVANRLGSAPNTEYNFTGFRCVYSS